MSHSEESPYMFPLTDSLYIMRRCSSCFHCSWCVCTVLPICILGEWLVQFECMLFKQVSLLCEDSHQVLLGCTQFHHQC